MRLVLGLSLTASSAVWVLVDTVDGTILAEEVVALDSLHEIARAAARSVQAFDMQTEHDIEGVRMTSDDDARQHGIRLRTKLRLFGFETVETVTEDQARAGRNKTARHIAPHLALAYGAARADYHADEGRGVLQRLAARVPLRVAAAGCAAAVVAVGIYGMVNATPSQTPETAAAESVPAQSGQPTVAAPAAAPAAVPAAQAAPPVAAPVAAPEPVAEPEPLVVWQPAIAAVEPDTYTAPEATTGTALDSSVLNSVPDSTALDSTVLNSTVPETISAITGEPHLPAVQPVAGPAQAQAPVTILPAPAPPPAPSVLSGLFSALP